MAAIGSRERLKTSGRSRSRLTSPFDGQASQGIAGICWHQRPKIVVSIGVHELRFNRIGTSPGYRMEIELELAHFFCR